MNPLAAGIPDRPVAIDGESLTLEDLRAVARGGSPARLSAEARRRVSACRALVERMAAEGRTVYGVTTGFGKCSEVRISPEETATLQRNLLLSHAAAVGEPLPVEVVRAVMLLRANALAKGYSGVRPEVIDLLLAMLNEGVTPVMPGQGSLGASGDLAPLAHLGLVLMGEGEAWWRGLRLPGGEALARAGLSPLALAAKEGLALINGTQVMTALLALAAIDAEELLLAGDLAAAMSFDALGGIAAALDPRVHAVRPHRGQGEVAARLRLLLRESGRLTAPGERRVQDAYTLRCTPQVHGASWDAYRHVCEVVRVELNAATDNPLLFMETNEAISGGNFHGQPLALAADYLAIALAELADIAERRIERLVNPALSGLPAFLAPRPGLNSGFMIAQYTAASLVSENKILAHPASVDSIPSSANQEDHVSMGTTAARKLRRILANVRYVLAIEYLVAAQALDLGPSGRPPGAGTRAAHRALRRSVPFMEQDRLLHKDIESVRELLADGTLLRAVDEAMEWRNVPV